LQGVGSLGGSLKPCDDILSVGVEHSAISFWVATLQGSSSGINKLKRIQIST
jgi:hypothetical protein